MRRILLIIAVILTAVLLVLLTQNPLTLRSAHILHEMTDSLPDGSEKNGQSCVILRFTKYPGLEEILWSDKVAEYLRWASHKRSRRPLIRGIAANGVEAALYSGRPLVMLH